MEKSVGAVLRNLNGPVLITGHTGFKGTWLTRLLGQLEVEVVGFSLPTLGDELYVRSGLKGQIREEFSDICDFESINGFVQSTKPGAIIHLAGQSLVLESYKNPLQTFNTNVMGTANLLEAARICQETESTLIATTDKVYQNLETGERFTELSPLLGRDPYSASKVGTENVAVAWRNLSPGQKNSNISVVRSGNVIGGGDYSRDRLIPDLVRAHQSGACLEIRSPESTRPWQHVLDPLLGYILALEKSISTQTPEIYNFGPSEPSLSVKEVLAHTQNIWTDISFKVMNDISSHESRYLELDGAKARRYLNWEPKYDQKAAITLTLQWWDRVLAKKVTSKEAIDWDILNFLS
jgi:CDP-glucose 4,6-dehydratase